MNHEITLDVCGLEPPEPLEQIMDALARLAPDQCLCVLIDREPYPLYSILADRNFIYRPTMRADYRYEILIWRKP